MPRPRRKRVPDVVRFREQQEQSATEFETGEYVHVPVRSGRQAEHARLAGMGPAMRPNAGIGKGNARGTELGQADFRRATFVCGADGCNALVDLLWHANNAKRRRRLNAKRRRRLLSMWGQPHAYAQRRKSAADGSCTAVGRSASGAP